MRVAMYTPDRGYGFAKDEEDNTVFFSAVAFERLEPGGPPPVLGELVEVLEIQDTGKSHPKARRVVRQDRPTILSGIVKRFDSKGGWGFVVGDDGVEYFLHRSDIASTSLPIPGGRAVFYPCRRKGKPRACHVTLSGSIHR